MYSYIILSSRVRIFLHIEKFIDSLRKMMTTEPKIRNTATSSILKMVMNHLIAVYDVQIYFVFCSWRYFAVILMTCCFSVFDNFSTSFEFLVTNATLGIKISQIRELFGRP